MPSNPALMFAPPAFHPALPQPVACHRAAQRPGGPAALGETRPVPVAPADQQPSSEKAPTTQVAAQLQEIIPAIETSDIGSLLIEEYFDLYIAKKGRRIHGRFRRRRTAGRSGRRALEEAEQE